MTKRYNACTPRPKKDGGTWWHRIGTGFEGDKGINVVLDSLPIPDKDGRLSISLFEQRDEQQRVPGSAQTPVNMDDAVPF